MLPLGLAQPNEQPRLLQQLSRFYLLPFPEKKIRIPYNLNAPRTLHSWFAYEQTQPFQATMEATELEVLTQDNAVALSAWLESLNTHDDGREQTDPVKNMSLYHCMAFFPLVAIC